jgi:hypothetical protein
MTGEELYNANVAKDPTFNDGKPRPPWNKLGDIFRKNWEQLAEALTPCDFCNQPGHTDAPCPVRHESAVRHAEEGAKAYPPATGVEAMVCDVVAKAVLVEGMTEEIGGVISREIAARQRLGIAKYGTTLADNRATLPVRLRHALEESLDLAVYAQWAMEAEDAAGLLPSLAGIRGVALIVAERLLNVMLTTEGGQP